MSPSLFLSLRQDVSCDPGDDGELVLRDAAAQVVFKHLGAGSGTPCNASVPGEKTKTS